MATGRPFQVVVFGASGFTGQFVVEELARVAAEAELRGSVRWAVAGRNEEKLRAVVEKAAGKLGEKRRGGWVGLCAVAFAQKEPEGHLPSFCKAKSTQKSSQMRDTGCVYSGRRGTRSSAAVGAHLCMS